MKILVVGMMFSLTACGKNDVVVDTEVATPEPVVQTPAPTAKPKPTQVPTWYFDVGGTKSEDFLGYEITNDRIPVQCKIVTGLDDKNCIILYDIKGATLSNYETERGMASYKYKGNGQLYYAYVLVEGDNTISTYRKMQALADQGVEVVTNDTPIGEASFCVERTDAGVTTYGTVLMSNGYYCTIKFISEIDFNEAKEVMNAIYSDGITVVINSTEEPSDESSASSSE